MNNKIMMYYLNMKKFAIRLDKFNWEDLVHTAIKNILAANPEEINASYCVRAVHSVFIRLKERSQVTVPLETHDLAMFKDPTDTIYCKQLIEVIKYPEVFYDRALGYEDKDICKKHNITKASLRPKIFRERVRLVQKGYA